MERARVEHREVDSIIEREVARVHKIVDLTIVGGVLRGLAMLS